MIGRRSVFIVALFVASCSSADPEEIEHSGQDGGAADAATGATDDAATDTGMACAVLFGAPNEMTGLTADQCAPSCECSESFSAPTFTDAQLEWMRTIAIDEPFDEVGPDPYDAEPPYSDGVCGIVVAQDSYRLETFPGIDDMVAAGASLTHWGDCGVCSTLENFAVYAGTSDLTQPVRSCGLQNAGNLDGNITCLQDLGFDLPCAQIWAYNTRHTRENCLEPCIQNLSKPYNLPDGSLNPCLACDEEMSGPVFKAVAGRTRRNSGLASALCRPCSDVRPVSHGYLP